MELDGRGWTLPNGSEIVNIALNPTLTTPQTTRQVKLIETGQKPLFNYVRYDGAVARRHANSSVKYVCVHVSLTVMFLFGASRLVDRKSLTPQKG
jgi:hypothetical protein